jgi:hypothetical protein
MPDTPSPSHILKELDVRRGSGLDVTLYWDPDHDRVLVSVSEVQSGDYFVLWPDKSDALDAFRHPYGYAARQGLDVPVARRSSAATAAPAGGQ